MPTYLLGFKVIDSHRLEYLQALPSNKLFVALTWVYHSEWWNEKIVHSWAKFWAKKDVPYALVIKYDPQAISIIKEWYVR